MGAELSMPLRDLHGTAAPLPQVAIVGWPGQTGNGELIGAWTRLGLDAGLVRPREALGQAPQGGVALVRLDVLHTLDGIEPGLEEVRELERRGRVVLNRADALLAAHDKLRTAALLLEAGVPHPETGHVDGPWAPLPVPAPLVVKPRFGSWGRDVFRCETVAAARLCLLDVLNRPWFRLHGALVQELLPSAGWDLRVVVARGRVVGAARRTAARGEWRTNVSLGGGLEPAMPPPAAQKLACAAAAALGSDLVGVDLLRPRDEWIVVELNGAVDFDRRYSFPGRDVFRDTADALGLLSQIDERGTP